MNGLSRFAVPFIEDEGKMNCRLGFTRDRVDHGGRTSNSEVFESAGRICKTLSFPYPADSVQSPDPQS
jgi:hypothetical protein